MGLGDLGVPKGSFRQGLGLFDVCPTREEVGASQAPTGRR